MDKKKALKEAKESYEEELKQIELAEKITKKIDPLLPKGWESHFDRDRAYPIVFQSGTYTEDKPNKKPAEEFKLVCKLVEKLIGIKLIREAHANKENGLYGLEGHRAHYVKKIDGSIKVLMYNPDHSCEVKFEREYYLKAIVSDDCLGLQGEA